MIYSFCKTQQYIRFRGSSSRILPSFKDVNFFQKHGLVSFAIRYLSGNATDKHSFTISYLINSCGLSPQSALAACRKVHFETPKKPDSVISFFKNHGFSQTQITKLIKRAPELLVFNAEKTLLPKFRFFYSKGISSSDLAKTLSSRPVILKSSLNKRIIPSFNLFKDFTQCDDDKVLIAFKRNPRVLQNDFQSLAAPNIAVVRECGVPECNIMRFVTDYPNVFGSSNGKFKRTVEEVKKLGFNPLKRYFLVAVRLFIQISKSTRERKLNVFKDYGWSDEEIVLAFGRFPDVLGCSEHNIKATMDYYVNTIGLKSSYIVNSPYLLGFSLEKRIIPRFEVFQVLLAKGLIKKISIHRMLTPNEEDFLRMYVIPHEYPHLLKLYQESRGSSK